MKMFELPVSDCGCFVAGLLDDVPKPEMPNGEEPPRFGVVIWYKTKEASKAACDAAVKAHW